MLVVTESVESFTGNTATHPQLLAARSQPLTGAEFLRVVVIISREVLLELPLRVRQILMSMRRKHICRAYLASPILEAYEQPRRTISCP